MGNTWITDLTHFLTKDGAAATMPGPARRLVEFLGKIGVHAGGDVDMVAPPLSAFQSA